MVNLDEIENVVDIIKTFFIIILVKISEAANFPNEKTQCQEGETYAKRDFNRNRNHSAGR